MRKVLFAATLLAVGLPVAPAMARQSTGYATRTTMMRAGPDYSYPSVQRLGRTASMTVYGCLRDRSWCDVSARAARGWVAARDIVVDYRGRRGAITSTMGIGILAFVFGSYWDNHYRSSPFYAQRPRWEQQYNNYYRPAWGPRPGAQTVIPRQPRPGFGVRPQALPQAQSMPQRGRVPNPPAMTRPRVQPSAPQIMPQGAPGAGRQRNRPVPQQAAPPRPTGANRQGGNGSGGANRQGGQGRTNDQGRAGKGDKAPH